MGFMDEIRRQIAEEDAALARGEALPEQEDDEEPMPWDFATEEDYRAALLEKHPGGALTQEPEEEAGAVAAALQRRLQALAQSPQEFDCDLGEDPDGEQELFEES